MLTPLNLYGHPSHIVWTPPTSSIVQYSYIALFVWAHHVTCIVHVWMHSPILYGHIALFVWTYYVAQFLTYHCHVWTHSTRLYAHLFQFVWTHSTTFILQFSHIGTFHLVRTHLGGGGGVKSPIHLHCVLHAKRGEGDPDSI